MTKPQNNPPEDWYADELFKLASCFHWHRFEEVGSSWDPETYLKRVRETGVKTVTLEAKDSLGYRYYEGDHGNKHPKVDWDYYGERSKVLKENDCRVVAYFGLGDDSAEYERNPQWRKLAQGEDPATPHKPDTVAQSNLNSPYFEEVLLRQLREFLPKYQPDALWLDIFTPDPYWGLSDDPWTRELFKREMGRPLPGIDNDPAPRETAEFFIRHAERLRAKIIQKIRDVAPGVKVAISSSFRYPREEGIVTDFLSRDTFWGYCGEICESGYYARLWSATGVASEIISPSYRWWGEKDRKSVFQVQREACSVLAAGSTFMCYVAPGEDGTLNERACRDVGQVKRYVDRCEPWFKQGRPHPELILFTCSEAEEAFSRRFLENRAAIDHHAQTNPRFFAQDFECAARYLQRNGFNYGVQTERTLEEHLSGTGPKLIAAPNLPELSEANRTRLLNYVQQGGILLLCGSIDPGLAKAIGLECRERKMPARCYGRPANSLTSPTTEGFATPLPVPFCEYELDSSETLVEVTPLRHEDRFANGDWFAWGYPDPDPEKWHPGASVRDYGQGRILYYSFNPFLAQAIEPTPQTGAFIADPIKWAGYQQTVRVVPNIPVETSLWRNPSGEKGWCHFINHAEAFEMGRNMTIFPGAFEVCLKNIEIEVVGKMPEVVTLQPSAESINPTPTKEGWRCTLPELQAHALLEWK